MNPELAVQVRLHPKVASIGRRLLRGSRSREGSMPGFSPEHANTDACPARSFASLAIFLAPVRLRYAAAPKLSE